MKINNVYIGGWFQRTMLQLSEIYDFIMNKTIEITLDKVKLDEFRKNLEIEKVTYGIAGEEYIEFTTKLNIKVKIFEDGLIVLKRDNVNEESLFEDVACVKNYYENNLSSAFNYLFSLGAPVPKELANIENVYPYFIVCDNATKEEMNNLLIKAERQKNFEFNNKKYDVIYGDKYYIINNKKHSARNIERYIEEQIFIRDFKAQLHRYLNIHRIIWEKIDAVKENAKVKGSDIVKFTTKLEGYAKTINLIDGRIKQMGTYISTREKIAKSDKELSEFLSINGYRYETLRDTLEYVNYLWNMTTNYVVSAQKLFEGIKADVTNKSVSILTIVTSLSAGASVIRLLTSTEPKFTVYGIVYLFILLFVGWASIKLLAFIAGNRKYEVSDDRYDKNIK